MELKFCSALKLNRDWLDWNASNQENYRSHYSNMQNKQQEQLLLVQQPQQASSWQTKSKIGQ